MDSDVLARPLNPEKQIRRHPHNLLSRSFDKTELKTANSDTSKNISLNLDLIGCQSEIQFFSLLTYSNISVFVFFTRAAPLIFAVNIETNGNPHHNPRIIGNRLLSSWLPVRSAKDQGGKGHTHIVR